MRSACSGAPTAPAATPDGTRPQRHVRVAVVHAVVTREHARGHGCARALLDAVTSAARQARADHLALVTDVADPTDSGAATGDAATGEAATGGAATGAAGMYEALGWERVDVRRHRDGRWVAEYRFALAAGSEATAAPPTARLERSA